MSFSLISDIGKTWGENKYDWVTTAGLESRLSVIFGNMPVLIYSAGIAQTIDQWSDNLMTLSKVIEYKDIKAVLADPKISQAACASLLMGFLNIDDNQDLSNFNNFSSNKKEFIIRKSFLTFK